VPERVSESGVAHLDAGRFVEALGELHSQPLARLGHGRRRVAEERGYGDAVLMQRREMPSATNERARADVGGNGHSSFGAYLPWLRCHACGVDVIPPGSGDTPPPFLRGGSHGGQPRGRRPNSPYF
jgi:hypothetical protein